MLMTPKALSLNRWVQSHQARAVRDGMLWLVPYLMLWSSFVALAEWSRFQGWDHWLLQSVASTAFGLRELLPLAMWGAIGSMLALHWQLPRVAVASVCAAVGLLAAQMMHWRQPGLLGLSVPLAMLGPLFLVPVMVHISRQLAPRWGHAGHAAGPNVGDVLALVLPAVLATLLFMSGLALLLVAVSALPAVGLLEALRSAPTAFIALLYGVLNSVLWFLGVHGYYMLLPLLELIPATANAQTALTPALLGAFVFIGGSGGTASLVLAILLLSGNRKHRLLAVVSLAPAAFNVNELLLFGLPLIMNRALFWPFLLVPAVNLGVLLLALSFGWVHGVGVNAPFNSPLFLNAMLVCQEPHAALALQCFNLALGAALYACFLRRYEGRLRTDAAITLKTLETCYARHREEAALKLDDPVSQAVSADADRRALKSRLQAWDQGDLELHYQPKVNPATGRVTGCEALLRLNLGGGRVLCPSEFLEDLSRAGLMKSLDHWVLVSVIEQMNEWWEDGRPGLGVSVNLSVDTLADAPAMKSLVALIARCRGPLIFEITEQSLVSHEEQTRTAIESIRQAGARVHIDDFGTGYSSLSYLHRFDIDGIKIDRSFSQALDTERGRKVFANLCGLAQDLNLCLVVEGLEASWQLSHLPANPQLTVQGWIYAGALPPATFVAFTAVRNA